MLFRRLDTGPRDVQQTTIHRMLYSPALLSPLISVHLYLFFI